MPDARDCRFQVVREIERERGRNVGAEEEHAPCLPDSDNDRPALSALRRRRRPPPVVAAAAASPPPSE